jgi:hypothetical protein
LTLFFFDAELAMETRSLSPKLKLPEPDLRPYAGRWVALIRGRVAGVGLTAEEARTAAKLARPKEEPVIRFVPEAAQRTRKPTDRTQSGSKS